MFTNDKPQRRPFKRILFYIFLFVAILLVVLICYIAYVYIGWNSEKQELLSRLEGYKRQLDFQRKPVTSEESSSFIDTGTVAVPSRIYGIHGELIGEFYVERRNLATIETMSPHFPLALVASEDRKFYQHNGFDAYGILRAALVNVMNLGYVQGGSTITQQLAKVLFTNKEKSIQRKIYELFCAIEIEKHYTKKQILEMYLNLIYTGHGNYGVDAAAQFFFNKSAKDVTLPEVAMIIGVLPNPENYSPLRNLPKSLARQKITLTAMTQMNELDADTANRELKKFFKRWQVVKKGEEYISEIGNFQGKEYRINLAPFFLDYVYQKLQENFTPEVITRGGLSIYTTLDYKRQVAAKRAVMAAIDRQREFYKTSAANLSKAGKSSQAKEILDKVEKTEGAFIGVDPRDGSILSMVGGYEYSPKNQFNRAILARRQTGSILKPLVYYLAVKRKAITPATLLDDSKLVVGKTNFKNYDSAYLGEITARDALRKSRNTVAVRLLQSMGIDEFRQLLADLLDVSFSHLQKTVPRELGIALGSSSFTPAEIARMYMPMVNQGKSVPLKYLLRVEDKLGRVLWQNEQENSLPRARDVLDPTASYITLTMLQGVFEQGGTAPWVNRLREQTGYLSYDIAGKTGTTSDYRDAWFLGMTSDEVSVVWIGNDTNIPLGNGRSGGVVCSPVWIDYIRSSRHDTPPQNFYHDFNFTGITRESFCSSSGGVPLPEHPCPDIVANQVFYSGTEPRFFDKPKALQDVSQENKGDIFQ